MSTTSHVTEVADEELLARFVFSSRYIRQDGTVRPETFDPSPHAELSVTRSSELSRGELGKRGNDVALLRSKSLLGAAMARARSFRGQKLIVRHDPTPTNPEHAAVEGWPQSKAERKMVLVAVAADAEFVPLSA